MSGRICERATFKPFAVPFRSKSRLIVAPSFVQSVLTVLLSEITATGGLGMQALASSMLL